jgi:uncharacterized protein involved in oxidation of intracellular sulfur
MKIMVLISTGEPETAWNAFRYAVFAAKQGDEVKVFLISKGVETEHIEDEKFNVVEEIRNFIDTGGEITVCGTCLAKRKWDMPRFGKTGTLANLDELIKESDKVISF